jgi:hypothetical protein
MSLRREHQRIQDDFRQAAGLLRHDLVWDSDFESIRLDLAEVIERRADLGVSNEQPMIRLVQKIIASENDLTV